MNKRPPSSSERAAKTVYARFLLERGYQSEGHPGDDPPDWEFVVKREQSPSERWAVEVTELHRHFQVGSKWIPEKSISYPVLKEQDRRVTTSGASGDRQVKIVRLTPGERHPASVLADIEPESIILVSMDPAAATLEGHPHAHSHAEFAKIATDLAIKRKVPILQKLTAFDRRVILLYSEYLFPPDPKSIMEVLYRLADDLRCLDEVCLIHGERITVVLGRREDFGRESG